MVPIKSIHIDMRSRNKGEWSIPSSALRRFSKWYQARGWPIGIASHQLVERVKRGDSTEVVYQNRGAESLISSMEKWEYRIIHQFLEVGIPGSFPGIKKSLISGLKKHFTRRWKGVGEQSGSVASDRGTDGGDLAQHSAGDVFHRIRILIIDLLPIRREGNC